MRKIFTSLCCSLCALILFALPAQVKANEAINLTDIVTTRYLTTEEGVGQYLFLLCEGPYTIDDYTGVYHSEQYGKLCSITLYAEPSSAASPKVPNGTYTMKEGTAVGTWSNELGFNYIIDYTSDGETSIYQPSAGELTVTTVGSNTVIEGTVTTEKGTYDVHFNGVLPFQGESADNKLYDPINTTFIAGSAIYREQQGTQGLYELQLYDVEAGEYGEIVNGNIAKLQFYAPQYNYTTGKFNSVPTGTFPVSDSGELYTLLPGFDDGVNIPVGSYVASNFGGTTLFGMFADGTVTIAADGDGYLVTVDVTTDTGTPIKGTFRGQFEEYFDLVGSGNAWTSTIKEDKQLAYPDIKEVKFNDFGDFYNQGCRVVEMQWLDKNKMEGTVVELLLPMAEKGTDIPDGIYRVSPKGTWTPSTFSVGQYINGFIIGSWGFLRLGITEDGGVAINATEAGPAADGTVTFTKVGDNYQVNFDFVDDTPFLPYRMYGNWTGKITYVDAPAGITAPTVTPNGANQPVYNLQGIQQRSIFQQLPYGIYIQGGKKFLKK